MIFLACPPVYTLPGTWSDPEKIAKALIRDLSPTSHSLKTISRGKVEPNLKVINQA